MKEKYTLYHNDKMKLMNNKYQPIEKIMDWMHLTFINVEKVEETEEQKIYYFKKNWKLVVEKNM